VVHVPAAADNTLALEDLAAAIDERTAIVSITHVCYRNGSRLDVEAIVGWPTSTVRWCCWTRTRRPGRCRSTSARWAWTSSWAAP